MAHIGFIGLGHMGLPIAINLLKAQHTVLGFDLQASAMDALMSAGGNAASNLAQISLKQDILITMLQTGQQVQQVCLGSTGLFAQAKPGTLFIDCSSIDIACTRHLHEEASKRGLLMVDAPVSGGVASAAAGTLTTMVGGTQEAYTSAHPILSAFSKKIIHTGIAGTGQAAKICNNMILGISMIAVSEAFVLAESLGLSPEKLFDVVTHASGQCWTMSHYPPVPNLVEHVPANHDYQPGFTTAMMLKDLRLSQDCAKTVGVETPLGEHATALYQQFHDQGKAGLDFSAIITSMKSILRAV